MSAETSNKLYRSNDAELAAFMLAISLQVTKPRMLTQAEILAACEVIQPFCPPWWSVDDVRCMVARQAVDALDYLTRPSFP